MSMAEGSVLHRISSSVFRTGQKPPLSPRSRESHPTFEHAARSAASVFGLATGAQAAISLALSLFTGKKNLAGLRAALSPSALLTIVKTSSRFGLFIGLLNFAVQWMDYVYYRINKDLLQRQRRGDSTVDRVLRLRGRLKNLVTAAMCAAALALEEPSRRHNIALFLVPRAVDTLNAVGIKKRLIPDVPHAPTMLFTVGTTYEKVGMVGLGTVCAVAVVVVVVVVSWGCWSESLLASGHVGRSYCIPHHPFTRNRPFPSFLLCRNGSCARSSS